MPFLPQPDETIDFKGRAFRFVQHRAAGYRVVHAETGARATVFLAEHGGDAWALKVFRPKFRKPHQAEVVMRLAGVRGMAGLRAAEREVVLPDDALATQHKDLAYAQLMPWVSGVPWANVLSFGVQKNRCYLDPTHAFGLCRRFLTTMRALESRTLAHTDIASGNVLVDLEQLSVELIDLEEMFGHGFPEPAQHNIGSAGYTHRAREGLWGEESDRFATTILASEMILLSHPELAQRADAGGGYFDNDEFGVPSPRFQAAHEYLSQVLPNFADAFARSWSSRSVRECPSAAELLASLDHDAASVPAPTGPALVPLHHSPSWTPPVASARSASRPPPSSTSTPPASNSTPPASDPDVVIGWNRLGAQPDRKDEGHVSRVRRPVLRSDAPPPTGNPPHRAAPVSAPTRAFELTRPRIAPNAGADVPLFAHRDFTVMPDFIVRGSETRPLSALQSVSIERSVATKDIFAAAFLSPLAGASIIETVVGVYPMAFAFGSFTLFCAGIYVAIGPGQPTLVLRWSPNDAWEIPMESREIAERGASALKRLMP
jgi:serine/threonine protein kinase